MLALELVPNHAIQDVREDKRVCVIRKSLFFENGDKFLEGRAQRAAQVGGRGAQQRTETNHLFGAKRRHPRFQLSLMFAKKAPVFHQLELAFGDRDAVLVQSFTRNAATGQEQDRKSTRLNSSHVKISYAVFC